MNKNSFLFLFLIFSTSCTEKEGFTIHKPKLFIENNLSIEKQEQLNLESAQELLTKKSVVIDDLLEPKYDPYMGEVNLPDKCQRKNVPATFQKNNSSEFFKLFSFYSSKQKIIGHCPGSGQLLKTQYLLIYCASLKTFIIAKYFYAEDDPWILEPLVKCNDH